MQEFIWPAFKNEKERIRHYSALFKNTGYVYGHNQIYKDHVKTESPLVPKDYVVGDVVDLRILEVSKDKVVFDTKCFKTNVRTKNNLNNFKLPLPYDTQGRVVRIQNGEMVVDILGLVEQQSLSDIIANKADQYHTKLDKSYQVLNLRLVRGGFLGDLVLHDVADIVGEAYTTPAFIPGSQIVLNRTDNFDKHVGTNVRAFISSVSNQGNVICSVKDYLQHQGNMNIIRLFNNWCEKESWDAIKDIVYDGKVTGVINSNSKCGVFVEIPSLNITGMITTAADELVYYKPHQSVRVRIDSFLESTTFNPDVQQRQRELPYCIEDDILKYVTVKPILKFA